MTDAKKPTITMPDLKRDREDESNALYVMRLVQQPVLPQDAYSPNEVARLLNISKKRGYRQESCALFRQPHKPAVRCGYPSSRVTSR